MPDPNLILAMEEIKAVLTKYDIGAAVVLASQSHLEYLNHIAPSWSCAKLTPTDEGQEFRIRAKAADFPSKAAHKKCLEDTVGMILGFADAQLNCHNMMLAAAGKIGRHMEIEHRTTEE